MIQRDKPIVDAFQQVVDLRVPGNQFLFGLPGLCLVEPDGYVLVRLALCVQEGDDRTGHPIGAAIFPPVTKIALPNLA